MRRLVALLLLVSTGCATAVNGRFQTIEVSSTPAGAQVRVECDGESADGGITPAQVRIRRAARQCQLVLDHAGYVAAVAPLARTRSGAVWLNVLPGVALGIVTGAIVAIGTLLSGDGDDNSGIATVTGLAVGTGGGVLIDRATGAAYKHVPERVDVALEPVRSGEQR